MLTKSTSARWFCGPALVLYLATAKFLFHLLTAGRYGIFRDELYYLACGEHLAWGYVDQPPLIGLIAWFAHRVFDHSLTGLRVLPALAGAATIWLTGKITREMRGGAFAQVVAALAVLAAPVFLIVHHWLTMNAFEPLIWLGCAWCVVRAINREEPCYWIWFGVLAGLGMENKYTIVFFIAALVIALPLTSARRFLTTRQFWFGALIAVMAVWRWERTRVIVTDDQLAVVRGTLRRRIAAVRLERVGAVEVDQSLLGRLLGYGTLVAGPLEITYVPQPRSVYGLVESLAP